jgi:hypothetical protein
MTIDELKRALVEVSELCANVKCSSCPLAKRDEANVPYCPLIENEDGIRHDYPYEWDVDDWKEDSDATD